MNVLIKSLKNNFGENCQDVEVDQKSKDGMNESGFKDGFQYSFHPQHQSLNLVIPKLNIQLGQNIPESTPISPVEFRKKEFQNLSEFYRDSKHYGEDKFCSEDFIDDGQEIGRCDQKDYQDQDLTSNRSNYEILQKQEQEQMPVRNQAFRQYKIGEERDEEENDDENSISIEDRQHIFESMDQTRTVESDQHKHTSCSGMRSVSASNQQIKSEDGNY